MKNLTYVALCVIFWSLICIACYPKEMDYSSAVIHHTASPDVDIEEIRRWHMNDNGWTDVGYHFLIRANGDIQQGRSLLEQGAHAKGRNHMVGIALTGYDEFTKEQIKSLANLLTTLRITHTERHHEQCPGQGLTEEFIY